jgi:hypothetical protein
MTTVTNPSNVSAETFKNQANEAAENFKNKANEAASCVTDKARQAASDLGKKAEDAAHTVGGGMKTLADTIRDKGPHEGVFGSATSSVAGGLESGGQYLQEHGIGGIAEDLTTMIRRNPIPALLCAVGLGFFLARATARR